MERHPTDAVSLIFGLVFAGAGALLLAGRLDVLTQTRWLVPMLLIVVAVVMLFSASWPMWHGGGDQPDAAGTRPS